LTTKIVKATRPQAKFLSLPQRFRALVTGYGGGKTYCGSMGLCSFAWTNPRVNMGYFAPTYGQIRDIFFPTIEEVARTFALVPEIREGHKEVHLYSAGTYRSTIICRSMERPAGIVGFKIGHALVDEIDVLPKDKAQTTWRKILARMRDVDARNGVDLTTTPEGFKFTYDLFVKELRQHPERKERYALVQASTYDNAKNLPQDYIPSLLEAYPSELIEAYINGQFINLTSGTVFYKYNRIAHNSTEKIKENEPLFIGMDFNVQHMAASVFVKRENGFHAVSELKDIYDTPEMIEIIRDRWQLKGHRIVVYPDASGNSRKSVDASKSDIALLRKAGFEVRVKKANPFVKDRVTATNKAFEDGNLWINAHACPTIAACLEQQPYNTNGEPDKGSGHDHQNDATSYFACFEFPINRPVLVPNIRSAM